MDREPLDDVMRRVIGFEHTRVVREYEDLAKRLKGLGPVLDLGCGSGTLLESLRKLGVPAQGVDASTTAVHSCVSRGLNAVQTDILQYLESAAADGHGAVFAGHVVEHMRPDQARALFKGVWSVLRPGGRFLLLTPNPRNLYVIGEGFWVDPTHVRPYPAPLLKTLALDAGFSHCEIHPWWQDLAFRQILSGLLRWGMTAGLHSPTSTLLVEAVK
jgi:2-polyprenyl-3-methyl-5-hydroxy-6-metoxy-1,4-benzoquinol methylase